MEVVNLGIACALPVRPDLLGAHLEAYELAIPILQILRLCHRFGQGPDAHVTKLPIELVLKIEESIFDHALSHGIKQEWDSCFEHFEGRCQPVDHIDNKIVWPLMDQYSGDLCDECQTRGKLSDLECDECDAELMEKVNEVLMESHGPFFEACDIERSRWEELINQGPKGNFVKYDKILHQHFGLEAYFATTRAPEGESKAWEDDPSHLWQLEALQTTICYLTLPKILAPRTTYTLNEMEVDMGCATIHGAQSCLLDLSGLRGEGNEERTKRFYRALRILKLQPYAHPSQLRDVVSVQVNMEDSAADNVDSLPDKEGAKQGAKKVRKRKRELYKPVSIQEVR